MANDLLAISYRRFSWAVKLYPKPSRSVLTILLIDVALLPLSQYFVDSPNFLPVTRNEHVPWNKSGQVWAFIGSSIMSLLKEIPLQKGEVSPGPICRASDPFQFD